jgi:hypothetical protein
VNHSFTFVLQNPIPVCILGTWLINNIATFLVSLLQAPTKDSTPRYIWWFKVGNSLIGNLKRAQSTAIEQSPNWGTALDEHIEAFARRRGIVFTQQTTETTEKTTVITPPPEKK